MSRLLADARGLPFEPMIPPVRIVSLVPCITELLFDLGLGRSEVVGRTRYCVHPAAAVAPVPVVGGTRDVVIETVLARAPDLVIAGREENRRSDIERLEAAGDAPPIFVVDPCSVADAVTMIGTIGELIGRDEAAAELARRIEDLARGIDPPTLGSAVYLVWADPWMTVAPGTFISSMLRYAGFVNAIWPSWLADRTFPTPEAARYPVITLPEVVALAPGTILLPSEPHPFTGDEAEALASEFAGLDPRFGRRVRIRRVDGELFSWYGSRMELALESFSTGLSETSSAAGRR